MTKIEEAARIAARSDKLMNAEHFGAALRDLAHAAVEEALDRIAARDRLLFGQCVRPLPGTVRVDPEPQPAPWTREELIDKIYLWSGGKFGAHACAALADRILARPIIPERRAVEGEGK